MLTWVPGGMLTPPESSLLVQVTPATGLDVGLYPGSPGERSSCWAWIWILSEPGLEVKVRVPVWVVAFSE